MSTSVVTYGLIGINPGLSASVVGVNPTATTLRLGCPTENAQCKGADPSMLITFGPWAQQTPAPGAASDGVFDFYVGAGVSNAYTSVMETLSIHCQLESTTVPKVCTTFMGPVVATEIMAPTSTITNPAEYQLGYTQVPVTITAGLEKLTGASATPGSGSKGNAASSSRGISGGAIGLMVLALAFLLQ